MRFGFVSFLPDTELVSKFLDELKNNRLMSTRCKKCGTKYLPPRAHCACGSTEIEWYETPKQGKLLAYTIVAFPPESMTKYASYILAVAELDDGSRLLAHITDVTPKNLQVGMRLQVVPHQISADRLTFKFKPL
jgi:uncharacterized OB-fold protein